MNTTIGKSFALAMLLAIGVIGTMLALGMFAAKPASGASHAAVTVSVTPDKARDIGEYAITVADSGSAEIPVGGTITVTFGQETVPPLIAGSAIKIKASAVSGTGLVDQLVSPSSVNIDGKAVTMTVPDMDPSKAGDHHIGPNARIKITFTQQAGIQNANQASTALTLKVKTSVHTDDVTSAVFAIKASVSFSPSSGARQAVIAVTGVGMNADCSTCPIWLHPNPSPTDDPPTGASRGTGNIDADGVFTGRFTASSGTSAGGFVWVRDASGFFYVSSSEWSQRAGATPRSTEVAPGSSVSVDLVDYTPNADLTVMIGGIDITGNLLTVPQSGSTGSLTPFKFTVPTNTAAGTHKVTISAGTKSANFNIEVGIRIVNFAPATASPGQNITLSGTGLTPNGTIAIGALTAAGGDAKINSGETISIDNTGAWAYATRMPLLGAVASAGGGLTVTANDGTLTAKSRGFEYTSRTVTLTPAEAGPGTTIIVNVTGMTVDNGELAGVNAEFTVTSDGIGLSGTTTFPIGSDGSGTGVFTIPTTQGAGTVAITVTDNALTLNPAVATQNQTATAELKIPSGTVSVDKTEAATGNLITVSGSKFPPNTTGTKLDIGKANAIPLGGFVTDANGDFGVVVEVPPATSGGSLTPGTKIIEVTVGTSTGSTTAFAISNPSIVITPSSAAVEDTVVVNGTAFSSLVTVDVLTIGNANALPSPAPRAGRNGEVTATILVPLFNPGTYTVVMSTGANFTATGTFTVVTASSPPASTQANTQEIFAVVIDNDANLVRVWRFNSETKDWSFYDPREDFADANTLEKTGAGDIVWVNVNVEQEFQGQTLFPGWNLIVLT